MRASSPRLRSLVLFCAVLAAAGVAVAATRSSHSDAATPKPKPLARAVSIFCGAVVTTSVTMSNDLPNCSGTAITITAPHVTLNLNGHTIDGQGTGYGVSVNAAGDAVQNGTITDFATGVALLSTGQHAQSLRIASTTNGITSQDDNAVISGNSIAGSTQHGINVVSGSQVQITNNISHGNGGNGIQALDDNVTIAGNKTYSNGSYGIYTSSGISIVVSGNLANGNGGAGIQTGGHDTVTKNTANYNTGLGINAAPLDTDGGGNVAKGNGNVHQCANVICP